MLVFRTTKIALARSAGIRIQSERMALLVLAVCIPASLSLRVPAWAQEHIRFARHSLNEASEFSSATAFDVNQDGRIDIVSGAFWYESPGWEKHRFRDVEQIRGRFDDYSNLALDVDEDGDLDLVSVNYRSKSLYWCKNPGRFVEGELWEEILIDRPGPSETGRLVDIDGDGRLDVLPNGTQFAAWYEVLNSGPEPDWIRHALPEELAGHGVGAGDLNGDGRVDIVAPSGWAEAPLNPREDRWLWHPDFRLARDCALPILTQDVDSDGDLDLIWARGHGVGLYWTEQVDETDHGVDFSAETRTNQHVFEFVQAATSAPRWVTHPIDTQFACQHTLLLADLDQDGDQDLITGKRFLGHDGKDNGENDPLSIQWYEFDQGTKTWHYHPISSGGTCGIDLDTCCADLDDDGDLDLIAPARCGLYWLENRGKSDSAPSAGLESSIQEVEISNYEESHQNITVFADVDGDLQPIEGLLDHGRRRQHILSGMESVMGKLPSSESRVPLQVRVDRMEQKDGYYRVHLSFVADTGGDRVPAYLLIPKELTKPAAAMLCLHPTHPLGKAQICGLGGKSSRFYAHELAQQGFVCLAPDYPSFGEYDYDFEQDAFVSGSMKAIWNNIRAIDLLESLPCVDRDRIGVIGHSLGGHNALFTAAFDQRLRCVVTSCGFTAFADYYSGDLTGWTSPRYMPWIADRFKASPSQMPFDFHEVLAAVTPRPLFVSAPLQDSNFAVAGVRNCEHALGQLRERLERAGDWQFLYPDCEHDFPMSIRQQAYEWLGQQLD